MKFQVLPETEPEPAKKPNYLTSTDLVTEKGITFHPVHLCRLIKAGKFPVPIKLGGGRNFWLESDIDAFLAERRAEAAARVRPTAQAAA